MVGWRGLMPDAIDCYKMVKTVLIKSYNRLQGRMFSSGGNS